MARVIPSVAIWDDHDFRKDGLPGTNYPGKDESLAAFSEYWANDRFVGSSGLTGGMTTRLTYGNVDIYLLDGRFNRDPDNHVCFTQQLLRDIIIDIRSRLRMGNRMVILASGSTWNHTNEVGECFGADDAYKVERQSFYRQLQVFMGDGAGHGIQGLVFISGDIHLHEIYRIELDPSATSTKTAPEFVSSPIGLNSSTRPAQTIEGERIRSFASEGPDAKRGFATLEIDTTDAEPEGNWSLRVKFHKDTGITTSPYLVDVYTVEKGQFVLNAP